MTLLDLAQYMFGNKISETVKKLESKGSEPLIFKATLLVRGAQWSVLAVGHT
jgi:hypothetical protein